MKLLSFLIALAFAQAAVAAPAPADTAYAALRIFGKREGEKALNHVLELRGRSGSPQPAVWKLLIDDSKARGGVREIEVQKGRIISERTPTSRDAGAPMNFTQLNLDSDGAFTVLNQEAARRSVPFDSVDYVLRAGTQGAAPVWELTVSESSAGRVGRMRIAADSGSILEQDFSRPRNYAGDRSYVDEPAPRDRGEPPPRREYSDNGRDNEPPVVRDLSNFAGRVGRHFEKRGRQISNFFTGRGGSHEE